MSDEFKRKAPAADDSIVNSMVRIEGGIAPVIYWIVTTLAVVIVLLDAYLVVSLRQDGDPWGLIYVRRSGDRRRRGPRVFPRVGVEMGLYPPHRPPLRHSQIQFGRQRAGTQKMGPDSGDRQLVLVTNLCIRVLELCGALEEADAPPRRMSNGTPFELPFGTWLSSCSKDNGNLIRDGAGPWEGLILKSCGVGSGTSWGK